MCGRYTLKTDRKLIEKHFGLEDLPAFEPRYNLGPTQDGLVIRPAQEPGRRTAAWLRWGLIPSWTKRNAQSPLLINARSETAASKPVFRDAFRKRRCLVVADGFYEWTRAGPHRTPHHFTVPHGQPFAMAGLWERWHPPGGASEEVVESFTILTTAANGVVAPHHDRMPVILDPVLYDDWINPLLNDTDTLKRILQPFPAIAMLARQVTPRVNNIRHDDPSCLESPTVDTDNTSAEEKNRGQLGFDLGLE